jgi:hypothetical protein
VAASDVAELASAAGTALAEFSHGAATRSRGTWSAAIPALPIRFTRLGTAVRGLTPELSRAAKRRRLGRIVRPRAGTAHDRPD